MTDEPMAIIFAAISLILICVIYLHLKINNVVMQQKNNRIEKVAIFKINDKIAQQKYKITQQNDKIAQIDKKSSALNVYLNDVVEKLDSLIQKPNDIYIYCTKKYNNPEIVNAIIKETSMTLQDAHEHENKTTFSYQKPDDFFNDWLESLDFRDYEMNIKIQSKFINYFKDCDTILDIGCGEGDFLELCEKNGIHSIGIDISKKAIDACLEKKLDVRQVDVFKFLSDENGMTFDGIFCSHLIEHFNPKDVMTLLALSNSRLKTNGKMIFVTPNVESFETQTIHFWRDLTHIRFYQIDTLRKLFVLAGFEVLEAEYDSDTKNISLFEPRWVV